MVVQRFQSIELGDFLNGDSYLFAFRMELIKAKTNPMFQFMKQAKKKSKTSKKSPYSGSFFFLNQQLGRYGRFVFGRFVFGRFVFLDVLYWTFRVWTFCVWTFCVWPFCVWTFCT